MFKRFNFALVNMISKKIAVKKYYKKIHMQTCFTLAGDLFAHIYQP